MSPKQLKSLADLALTVHFDRVDIAIDASYEEAVVELTETTGLDVPTCRNLLESAADRAAQRNDSNEEVDQ